MARLLVKTRGDGRAFGSAFRAFAGRRARVETILEVPPAPAAGPGLAGREAATWLRVDRPDEDSPWDTAHALLGADDRFAAAGPAAVEALEPDIAQRWDWRGGGLADPETGDLPMAADEADYCTFEPQEGDGGREVGEGLAWHLGDGFTGLSSARRAVGADRQGRVLVAHLDTGFDPAHVTVPARIDTALARSFVDGDPPEDATDRAPPGMAFVRNRGHGTATLALLAGGPPGPGSVGWDGFSAPIGGAPDVVVVPVRIADWVVRLTTSTMVQGIDHARAVGAHVLTMSMGGVSSFALAEAVNLAYEGGLVMVTAAGNNLSRVPSPKTIVFPARWRRVIAACGVMAQGSAYAGLDAGYMQGNYGPDEKMDTAIGAFTPNVPWAQIDCGGTIHMTGGGTSSATPQVAAAAALWMARHRDRLDRYAEPWMRVEAVRRALFRSAERRTARMGPEETFEKIGRGVLDADGALKVRPAAARDLSMTPPSEALWGWLQLLFGRGVSLAPGEAEARVRRDMLCLELTQMAQRVPQVEDAVRAPEREPAEISPASRRRYLEAALDAGRPSKALRTALEAELGRRAVPGARPEDARTPAPPPVRRKVVPPAPPDRRLRVFALDPSLGQAFETGRLNEATIAVPWDDAPLTEEAMEPGPVGEYLEVIDIDPASGKMYAPVDLNDPFLLARDGLAPSEGDPKFHQQMVYAVAMKTIGLFEDALGRPALWSPRHVKDKDGDVRAEEVRRLRIYPHALREANAYYSPDRKALLFGYFPARSREGDVTVSGSMTFTCLSSDIIAHEMSHALLDGLHRRFQEASNPDVPAFHEAFADIVAIFQHFTMPELLRFEIARARGRLSAAQLLGGLARQFGEAASAGGPLRDYLAEKTRALVYSETLSPHDRGSILVLAVYDAFLTVVDGRIADLVRIATGGTGVLPRGELHPDLVERIAAEAVAAAGLILKMCIRALDYCPPVDITFGEYLRALVTAHRDVDPADPEGLRIAFIESFRHRRILPETVRTYSTQSLTWNTPANDRPGWLAEAFRWGARDAVNLGLGEALTRSQVFALNEENRWKVWRHLRSAIREDPALAREFGIADGVDRYDGRGRVVRRVDPGDTTFEVHSVRPTQRLHADGTAHTDVVVVVTQRRPEPFDPARPELGFFWFRSGATLLIDPTHTRPLDGGEAGPTIRYAVIKTSTSERRLAIQRRTATSGFAVSPMRALYFPEPPGLRASEPFAAMHRDMRGHGHG